MELSTLVALCDCLSRVLKLSSTIGKLIVSPDAQALSGVLLRYQAVTIANGLDALQSQVESLLELSATKN